MAAAHMAYGAIVGYIVAQGIFGWALGSPVASTASLLAAVAAAIVIALISVFVGYGKHDRMLTNRTLGRYYNKTAAVVCCVLGASMIVMQLGQCSVLREEVGEQKCSYVSSANAAGLLVMVVGHTSLLGGLGMYAFAAYWARKYLGANTALHPP